MPNAGADAGAGSGADDDGGGQAGELESGAAEIGSRSAFKSPEI